MAPEIESLKELYLDELKDLCAETQITKALPNVIKKVSSAELKKGLENHLNQTQDHVKRLEKIFSFLDQSPRGKKCVGMEGVLAEGKEIMGQKMTSPNLMDAALIGACQRVEHYEIAGYGTARAFAEMLGEEEAYNLLSRTLEEEKAADEKLTQVAMSVVNVGASNDKEMLNRNGA